MNESIFSRTVEYKALMETFLLDPFRFKNGMKLKVQSICNKEKINTFTRLVAASEITDRD